MRIAFRVYRSFLPINEGEKILVTEFDSYEAAEKYIIERAGLGVWSIEKVFIL